MNARDILTRLRQGRLSPDEARALISAERGTAAPSRSAGEDLLARWRETTLRDMR